MSRVGIFGRAVLRSGDKIIGICLGTGGYSEHQFSGDTLRNAIEYGNRGSDKDLKKGARVINKSKKSIPERFHHNIVNPGLGFLKREININNDSLTNYKNCLTQNGRHILIDFGVKYRVDDIRRNLGKRMNFSEAGLFYMEDYNFVMRTPPTILGTQDAHAFVASWRCDWASAYQGVINYSYEDVKILINDNNRVIADLIESNFHEGKLIIVAPDEVPITGINMSGMVLIFGNQMSR